MGRRLQVRSRIDAQITAYPCRIYLELGPPLARQCGEQTLHKVDERLITFT